MDSKNILLGTILFLSQLAEPGSLLFPITEYLTASYSNCGKVLVTAERLQVQHVSLLEYNLTAEKQTMVTSTWPVTLCFLAHGLRTAN